MNSVCMATYNGADYVSEQISSILCNLEKEDELIVSDDGSVDETLEIIRDFQSRDERIRLLTGSHQGIISNFSRAIEASSGEYVFLSDQDDVWDNNKVSKVIRTFQERPEAKVIVHNARLIDSTGERLPMTLFELRQSKPGLIKNIIKNSYVGCCMAFRRSVLAKAMPIPTKVAMHDWWIGLWGEIERGSVFINEELMGYRRHETNASSLSHSSVGIMISNRFTIITELLVRMAQVGLGLKDAEG